MTTDLTTDLTPVAAAAAEATTKGKREKHDLSIKSVRAKLPANHVPYWNRIDAGLFIGWRVPKSGEPVWYARTWVKSKNDYEFKTYPGSTSHKDVVADARTWRDNVVKTGGKAATKLVYVRDIFTAMAESYRTETPPRPDTAAKAEGRYRIFGVMGADESKLHRIAKIKLVDLRNEDVKEWRDEMIKREGLSLTSVERDLACARAPFTMAMEAGAVNKHQYAKALAKLNCKRNAREVYLTKEVRDAIIANMDEHYQEFYGVLRRTTLRPGAVSARLAQEWKVGPDGEGRLRVTTDKAGAGREIVLHNGVRTTFEERAAGKAGDALLFPNPEGTEITSSQWLTAFDNAVAKCVEQGIKVPEGAVPYSFRHSAITDAVIANKVSLAYIAKFSGTSLKEIEETYAKFLPSAAKDLSDSLE